MKQNWHSYFEQDCFGGGSVFVQKGSDKRHRELIADLSPSEFDDKNLVDEFLHEAFLIVESRNSEGF